MNLIKHRKILPAIISFVFLAVFIVLTNPQNLPLGLLFVPFILLFITIYYLVALMILYLAPDFIGARRVLIASIAAGLPVILLVLKSIGQYSFIDLLIVLVLTVLFAFYFTKADFIK